MGRWTSFRQLSRSASDERNSNGKFAEKANHGTLTADERAEYEAYIEELDVIAIFKVKARAALGRQRHD